MLNLTDPCFSFVSARILTGFAIAGIEASCFVMGMELVGPSKRTLAGILCWFFETTGKPFTTYFLRIKSPKEI